MVMSTNLIRRDNNTRGNTTKEGRGGEEYFEGGKGEGRGDKM